MGSAVVAVFNRFNEMLILQRDKNDSYKPRRWNLPGGKMDKSETPEQTADRECFEETGIIPSDLKPLEDISIPNFGTMYVFTAVSLSLNIQLSPESMGHAWISVDEVERYDFIPHQRDVVMNAFRNAPPL